MPSPALFVSPLSSLRSSRLFLIGFSLFLLAGVLSPTVLADTPLATIVSPADGARVRGSVEIAISFRRPFVERGVKRFEVFLDGGLYESVAVEEYTGTYTSSWNTAAVADGPHVIRAYAYTDSTGGVGEATNEVRVVVDNTPPDIRDRSPQPGSYASGNRPTVAATVADSTSGISPASIRLELNGVTMGHGYDPGTGRVSYQPSSALAESTHTARLRVADAAGNQSETEWSFLVDITPPVITIDQPATGLLTNQVSVTLAGSVDDHQAAVTVNGEAVELDEGGFTREISLAEGSNTIRIEAADAAGNTRTRTLTVTRDTVVPEVEIFSPEGGALLRLSPVTVTGQVSEPAAAVDVNGKAAAVDPATGNFTASGVGLEEGANEILVRAEDGAGNEGTAQISVTLDTVAPAVSIVSPPAGLVTTLTEFDVTGTVDDLTATVTVNGTAAVLDPGTGDFLAASVPLSEGTNTIRARATDPAGNLGTAEVTVTRDTTPPTLAISYPADGFIASQPALTVTGTTDATAFEVTVNGEAVEVSNGSFSRALVLDEGANVITARAVDAVGNERTRTVSGVLDTIPPAAPVLDPLPELTNNTRQVVTGSAEAGALVTVSGAAAEVSVTVGPSGSFTATVFLTPDELNILSVTASDAAGNVSPAASAPVTHDGILPAVTVWAPLAGTKYEVLANDPPAAIEVEVSGAASDLHGIDLLEVNGTAAALAGDEFNVPVSLAVPAELGAIPYNIVVAAEDGAGNRREVTVAVTVELIGADEEPPAITITQPPTDHYTNAASTRLSGTVLDASAIVELGYRVNGGELVFLAAGKSFDTTVSLPDEGEYTLTVEAEDEWGYRGSKSVVVAVDRQPPEPPAVQVINPPSPTNRLTVTLAGPYEPYYGVRVTGGTAVAETTATGSGNYSVSVGLAADTVQTLEVWGIDRAGNTSLTATEVEMVQDSVAPLVDGVNPTDGTVEVELLPTVTLNFSEAMAPATLIGDNVWLESGGTRIPAILAVAGGNSSITLTPETELADSLLVRVRASRSVTDRAGNQLPAAFSSQFTTVDLTPPGPVTLSPMPPALTNQPAVEIRGYAEAGAVVKISRSGAVVASGSADGTGLFAISAGLVANSANQFTITATDAAGNEGPAVTVTVTHDDIPPQVLSFNPAVGSEDVALLQTVTITFNEPLLAASVPATNRADGAVRVAAGGQIVPGNFSINTAKTLVNFIPASPGYPDSSAVTVTVATGVKDAAGNALAEAVEASFNIIDATPPDPPVVEEVIPQSPTREPAVTITGTAEAGSTVRVAGGASTVETPADPETGAFTIEVPLRPDAVNLLQLTAADVSGNRSAATGVEAVQDSTPPAVSSVAPADGSAGVAVASSVAVTFSEPVSPVSVAGEIVLAPAAGPAVAGELVFSSGDAVATFIPVAQLWTGTAYTVTVGIGVEDRAGNAMASEFTSTFTTSGDAPVLTPATPVLDPVESPTRQIEITISGIAEAGTAIEVAGGDAPAATTADGEGIFSLQATLNPNQLNTLLVTAANGYGASPAARAVVRHDTEGPVIAILSPVSGSEFAVGTIPISGTAADPSGIENSVVTFSGQTAVVSGGTFFFPAVGLAEGSNILTVSARDILGNVATVSAEVISVNDSEPRGPVVTITAPIEGAVVGGYFRVAGTVVAERQISRLWINDLRIGLDTVNSFDAYISLEDGEAVIEVLAVDEAGLEGSDAVNVLVDTTPPFLIVDEPEAVFNTIISPIIVSGRTEPGCWVVVENQGWGNISGLADEVGNFLLEPDLAPYETNVLSVTSTDPAGNQSPPVILSGFYGSSIFLVTGVTPEYGAEEVDLSSSLAVTFNQPVNTDTLLAAGSFRVLAGNEEIPGTISVSPSRTTATFTPYRILPGSSEISLLISSDVLSSDGVPLLNYISSFQTEQSPTSISGTILTPDLAPLEGATVRIRGTGLEATVNSLGGFIILDGVPPGVQELVIDGSTSLRTEEFPSLAVRVHIRENRDNFLPSPIFLTPVDTTCRVTISLVDEGADFNSCIAGLSLSFSPGSVTFSDGRKNGSLDATLIDSNNLPGRLPDGNVPEFLVRLGPAEVIFNPPALAVVPNLTALPPGEEVSFFTFTEGVHNYSEIGWGRVDESGLLVVMDEPVITSTAYLGFTPVNIPSSGPRYLQGRVRDSVGEGIVGVTVSTLGGGQVVQTGPGGFYELALPGGSLSGLRVFASVTASLAESTRDNAVLTYASDFFDPRASGITIVPDILIDSFRLSGDLRLQRPDGTAVSNWTETTYDDSGRLEAVSDELLARTAIMVFREREPGIFASEPIVSFNPSGPPSRSYNNIRFSTRIFNGPEGVVPPGEKSPVRLEQGELLRIVAYNRDIGYLGMSEFRVPAFTEGLLGELDRDVVLTGPEVRIRAERLFYANNERQRRLIPHGGVAMISDQLILIHTDWAAPDFPGASLHGRLITDALWGGEKDLRFTVPPGEALRVLELRGAFPDSRSVLDTVSEPGEEAVEISPERSFREDRILPLTVSGPGGFETTGIRKFQFRVSPETEIEPPNVFGITVHPPDESGESAVTGVSGAVAEGGTVIITNIASGISVQTNAAGDGSFSAMIPAEIGNILRIVSEDSSGNQSDPIFIEVVARPVIEAIEPDRANPGEVVEITGRYFAPIPSGNEVRFRSGALAPVLAEVVSASPTILQVLVPDGAVTGLVSVTVEGESSNGFLFTVTRPAIASIVPAMAGAGDSLELVILGEHTAFIEGETTIDFGPFVTVNSLTVESPVQIVAALSVSSLSPLGIQPVSVISSGRTLNYPPGFSIEAGAAPYIDSLQEISAYTLRIHGSNFRPALNDNRVYFSQVESWVQDAGFTFIDAVIPRNFQEGWIYVVVSGMESNQVYFSRVTTPPTPRPTGSPSPTATPEGFQTPTPSPSPSLTPEGYRTPSPLPTASITPVPSSTPDGYRTPTPGPSPTITPDDYLAPTPVPVDPTPVEAATPSPALSPTPAITPSRTPVPSPTPAPSPPPAPNCPYIASVLVQSDNSLIINFSEPVFRYGTTSILTINELLVEVIPNGGANLIYYELLRISDSQYQITLTLDDLAVGQESVRVAARTASSISDGAGYPLGPGYCYGDRTLYSELDLSPDLPPAATPVLPQPDPTPTPRTEPVLLSFWWAPDTNGVIAGALSAVEEIYSRWEADQGDARLTFLKNFFYNSPQPRTAIIRSYVNGAAAAEVLAGHLAPSGVSAGSWAYHDYTGLFASSVLAFSGADPYFADWEERVAFGLGYLAHHKISRRINPVLSEFAGGEYSQGGETAILYDYGSANFQTDSQDEPLVAEIGGTENRRRYKWIKNWFGKQILLDYGAVSGGASNRASSNLDYYVIDPLGAAQKTAIEEAYDFLYGDQSVYARTAIPLLKSELVPGFQAVHEYGLQMVDAHLNNYSLEDQSVSPGFIVFPDRALSGRLLRNLGNFPQVGIDYSQLYRNYLSAINRGAEETVDAFRNLVPFLEDRVIEHVTVRETRLNNLNLWTGRLSLDMAVPLEGPINPDKTHAFIANGEGDKLGAIWLDPNYEEQRTYLRGKDDGFYIYFNGPKTHHSLAIESTGRYGWVGISDDTIAWVDLLNFRELDQNPASGAGHIANRMKCHFGGGKMGPMVVSPDGTRLFAAKGYGVHVFHLESREFQQFRGFSDTVVGLSVTPGGGYLLVLAANENSGGGTLSLVDIRLENPFSWSPPLARFEVVDSAYMDGFLNGVSIDQSGERAYVVGHGDPSGTYSRYHSYHYEIPLNLSAGRLGVPRDIKANMECEDKYNQWNWLVNHQVWFTYLATAPYTRMLIGQMAKPIWMQRRIIDCNAYGLDSMLGLISTPTSLGDITRVPAEAFPGTRINAAAMLGGITSAVGSVMGWDVLGGLGGAFIQLAAGGMPGFIIILDYVNPVALYGGADVDVPNALYSQYPNMGFTAFDVSGNLGIFDLDAPDENKYIAATTNQLGVLAIGGFFRSMKKLAVSQRFDVVGIHPGFDGINFGNGYSILKALDRRYIADLTKIAINDPAYQNWIEKSFVFVNGVSLKDQWEKPVADNPQDVKIQNISYLVWPPPGQGLETDEVSYMLFSREEMDREILIYFNGREISPGQGVTWTQRQDRYRELVISDPSLLPEGAAYNLSFSVQLAHSPRITIGPGADTSVEPARRPDTETVSGYVRFDDNVPIQNAAVYLIRKDDFSDEEPVFSYQESSARLLKPGTDDPADNFSDAFYKVPGWRRTSTDMTGWFEFNLQDMGSEIQKELDEMGVNSVEYYLAAHTVGSNAVQYVMDSKWYLNKNREARFRHEGEALNWYADGEPKTDWTPRSVKPQGAELDAVRDYWEEYHDPFANPDVVITAVEATQPNGRTYTKYEFTGGDASSSTDTADIYFPVPMVYIHGINIGLSIFGVELGTYGGHPDGWMNNWKFFSHPDWRQRETIRCAPSYAVDTMNVISAGMARNAELVERFMGRTYRPGLRKLVNARFSLPHFNLISHSMGTVISRVWETQYNRGKNSGPVMYNLSASGILGGNLYASAGRVPATQRGMQVASSAVDCSVRRIRDRYDKSHHSPDGHYHLYTWGMNGRGHMGSWWPYEGEPNDGENSAPTATCQNGPYFYRPRGKGNPLKNPLGGTIGYPVRALRRIGGTAWRDRDIDMRCSESGKRIRQLKDENRVRMAYIDWADYPDVDGTHGAGPMQYGGIRGWSQWMGFYINPEHLTDLDLNWHLKSSEFAEWIPEAGNVPMDCASLEPGLVYTGSAP